MTETMASPSPAGVVTPRLETRGVYKSFGSVLALENVDFEVRSGEVMALVGDNGAGKSTLIKCIAGIYSIDEGDVYFEGEKVSISGPNDAAKLGIEVVYQDLALCDNLDVVQNMYLGREARDFFYRLKEPIMEVKTAETLESLRVTTIRSIRQPVASLWKTCRSCRRNGMSRQNSIRCGSTRKPDQNSGRGISPIPNFMVYSATAFSSAKRPSSGRDCRLAQAPMREPRAREA